MGKVQGASGACIEFGHARFRLSSCEGKAKDYFRACQGFEGLEVLMRGLHGRRSSDLALPNAWRAWIPWSGEDELQPRGSEAGARRADQGRPVCTAGQRMAGCCPGTRGPGAATSTHTRSTRFGLRSRVTRRTLGEGIRWLPVGEWLADLRPSTAASFAATGSIGQAARREHRGRRRRSKGTCKRSFVRSFVWGMAIVRYGVTNAAPVILLLLLELATAVLPG